MSLTCMALALALAQAPGAGAADPPAGAAQASQRETVVLTLEDALRQAAERNLDLRAAEARLRQARETSRQAWAGYLPSLTASGAYTRNEHEARIPALPPLFEEDIVILPKHQWAGQIEANQVLFSPSLWFGIRAASRGEDVTRLTIENVRRDILFGVAQAYYGVAALGQAREVSERLLEIARRQESDARVRHEAGTVARVALLRAEIDRARAEQDLLRARNAHESARIALATLLDRPVDFEVAHPPEPSLPADVAQLEEAALRERPDVLAARRSADAARASRDALTGRYFPDVAAFARWQIQNAPGFTAEPEQWAVGVGAQWRILDGGRREAEIRQASARIDEAEATAASAAARARQEVRQALLDLDSARANAVKAGEQRELAAENQRLVDVAFRAGAATAVEQADATAQLRTAEIAFTTETLGAQLAALRLLRVAGRSLR
jgi:outer membrane protein TolC